MATTLTVTQSGAITLDSKQYSTTVTKEYNVTVAAQHHKSVGTAAFESISPSDRGGFGYEDFKFFIIANTDATNFVTIYINDGDSGFSFEKILPGSSKVFTSNRIFNNESTSGNMNNIYSIYAKADTAAVELKLFVAA